MLLSHIQKLSVLQTIVFSYKGQCLHTGFILLDIALKDIRSIYLDITAPSVNP